MPLKKNSSDDYQTPPIALKPLLKYLDKNWLIWECACGNGNIVDVLKENKFNVIGTDIKNNVDFLNDDDEEIKYFDCIVTNPPYSLKDDFLKKCYELGKPFALLLPITALEGKSRQDLYKKYGLELILMDKRINFLDEENKMKKHGSYFSSAWFTYGLNLPEKLTFEKI